jgi:hypothetical protein
MKNEGNKNHVDNSRDELNKKIKNISRDEFINKIKEEKIKLAMKNNMNDDKKDKKQENNDSSSNNQCNDKSIKSITIENLRKQLKKREEKEVNLLTNYRKQSLIIQEPNKMQNMQNMQNSSINNSILEPHSWKKKYVFPLHYFYLDFLFDKLIHPQKFFCVSKTYFTVYNFMCQIYDISTHIILFKQFNILNNLLHQIYEENGNCPARPFKQININDTFIMEQINKDLKSKKSILFSHNLS